MYKKSSLNQLILGGLVYILIWASIDNFYALQKEEYALGKFVFLFLGLSQIINMAFGVNGIIINVSKYYRFDTVTSVLLALFTIVTNLMLIPIFGITGAAMATALSILVFNFVRYKYVLKKMNIQPFSIKTLGVILILLIGFSVTFILPKIDNIYFDTIFNSAIILIVIVVPIIYFKLSEEINGFYSSIANRFKS